MVTVKDKVTVIIPALNERESIAKVIYELNQNGYSNILVVDGNSTDGTDEIARDLGATVIKQDGSGKGAALRQAFYHGSADGDIIVIIDADGSMSPKELPLFVEAIATGADVVKGSRFLPGGYSEDMNFIRRVGNLIFLSLVNWLWSANYTDLCYGFGAFRKVALKKFCGDLKSKNFEVETEICIKANKLGLKIVEVPSIELRRVHGKSNLNALPDGFRILKTIFREFIEGNRARNRPSSGAR